VFLTGGCSSFPNLSARLRKEIQEMRPFQSEFNVSAAKDVALDAWKGARLWSTTTAMTDGCITVADYNENGKDYLKEHFASNVFVSSVKPMTDTLN
jgi:actin-related protein 5